MSSLATLEGILASNFLPSLGIFLMFYHTGFWVYIVATSFVVYGIFIYTNSCASMSIYFLCFFFVSFFIFCPVTVCLFCIMLFDYLDACLFFKERQKGCGFGWGGTQEQSRSNWGLEKCSHSISYTKSISNKRKIEKKYFNISWAKSNLYKNKRL